MGGDSMTSVKTLVKVVGERVVLASGIATLARRARRDQLLILAYHGIVPHGQEVRGDLSLHLPQRRFARQLDLLGRLGEVVSLADALAPSARGRPRFVITFDDAYAGALSAGVDELRRRGMPATVFVAPALLGGTTWWDAMADRVTGAVAARERDHALTRLAGRSEVVLQWAGEAGVAALRDVAGPDLPAIGSEAELRGALRFDGLTVGSHSWSHVNLAALAGEELERELRLPADWLGQRFPDRYLPWLSYPYGHFTPATVQAARNAGYLAAVRVDGGWLDPRHTVDRFVLPRHNIPRGLSERGFELRTSGIGNRGTR
jgi:peptidoglycan/xylan/chitin deacetylase (PgdA/CDA1 family)